MTPEEARTELNRTAQPDYAVVNYGEVRDLPASCFIDRQQSDPKETLVD